MILEMGMYAAYSIIEGKRRDIESIGSANKYFERGKARISGTPQAARSGDFA